MPDSKVLDWGKRYDFGVLYNIPALVGHEFALVSSGIRGGMLQYHPPETIVPSGGDGVEWEQQTGPLRQSQ